MEGGEEDRDPRNEDRERIGVSGSAPGELDELSTEELRQRAFSLAVRRRDIAFFWSIFKHLPHADDAEALDASLGAVGASVSDAVALWREFTGHGYGDAEPLLRAAFVSYLSRPDAD